MYELELLPINKCDHLFGVCAEDECHTRVIFLQKDPEETYFFYKDNANTHMFRFCPSCGHNLEE